MAGYISKRKLKRPTSDGRTHSWVAYVEAPRGPDGQRRKKKKSFATRKEADGWRIAQLSAKTKGNWVSSPGTLDDLMKRWLDVKSDELKPSAFHSYEGHVRRHLSRVGSRRVDKLNSSDFTRLYRELVEEGLSATTVRSVHASARACFSWAAGEEPPLVDRNIPARARPPKAQATEMTAWTPDEIRSIVEACELELATIVDLVAGTGLRRGEAAGLRWEDVDLEVGEIRVRQALVPSGRQVHVGPPKTEKSRRTIPIRESDVVALRDRLHRQKLERLASGARPSEYGDLVFTSADGASPWNLTGLSREFSRAVARAGVRPGRLHDLRHSFATLALTSGVPVAVVSRILGHSLPSTTMNTYAHALPDGARDAIEAVGRAIEGRSN